MVAREREGVNPRLWHGRLLLSKQPNLHLSLRGIVRDPFYLHTLPSVRKLRILRHITALVKIASDIQVKKIILIPVCMERLMSEEERERVMNEGEGEILLLNTHLTMI